MTAVAVLLPSQCLANNGLLSEAVTQREHVQNPEDQFEMVELFNPIIEMLSVRSAARTRDAMPQSLRPISTSGSAFVTPA